MNCQLIDRYIFDYCEDNVSPTLKNKIDQHLTECQCCCNQVKLTRLENECLADITDVPVLPDDFTAQIMHKVYQKEKAATGFVATSRPSRSKVLNLSLSAAVMGLMILLVVSTPKWMPWSQPNQVADQHPPVQERSINLDKGLADNVLTGKAAAPDESPTDNKTELRSKQNNIAYESDQSKANFGAIPDSHSQIAMAESRPSVNETLKQSDLNSPSRMGISSAPWNEPVQKQNLPEPKVPANFTLINVADKSSDTGVPAMEYQYSDELNRSLTINISSLPLVEPAVKKYDNSVIEEPSANNDQAQSDLMIASLAVTYNIETNGSRLQVSLNGTLPAEELGKLAESISFTGFELPQP